MASPVLPSRRSPPVLSLPLLAGALLLPFGPSARALELVAERGELGDYFGYASSLSGSFGLVGAPDANTAYLFRRLNTASGPVLTEDVRLTVAFGYLGYSTSLSGDMALVGSGAESSTYLYRHLAGAPAGSTLYPAVVLTSSAALGERWVGTDVALSGTTGLIASGDYDSKPNLAYLFRGLDTAVTGSVVKESVTLAAADDVKHDVPVSSVSFLGTSALIGADYAAAAYFYRNPATAPSGSVVTQDVKLVSSDGVAGDRFGCSVSLSGNSALVGAEYALDSYKGAAYLFRGLDTAAGSVVAQDVRLTASDGYRGGAFGKPVRLSGSNALVWARGRANSVSGSSGGAYLFRRLDSVPAGSTVTESVVLQFTDNYSGGFTHSIAMEGDRFIIGCERGTYRLRPVQMTGKAYVNMVDTFTVMDAGGVVRSTGGLSFDSREDWVIGDTRGGNRNTLSIGVYEGSYNPGRDWARVLSPGKGVHIGRSAGSDGNQLTVDGLLLTNFVRVGAAGNSGNFLRVRNGGFVEALGGGVTVAADSIIGGEGTVRGGLTLAPGAFLEFSTGSVPLHVMGPVSLPPFFGIPGLRGLTRDTPAGVYPLVDTTDTDFAYSGLLHWGESNASDLGGGKKAWFAQSGSVLRVFVSGVGQPLPDLPVLGITRGSGQVTLTWTTALTGLVPETAASPAGPWEALSDTPAQTGNTRTLTVPSPAARAFYRLRLP